MPREVIDLTDDDDHRRPPDAKTVTKAAKAIRKREHDRVRAAKRARTEPSAMSLLTNDSRDLRAREAFVRMALARGMIKLRTRGLQDLGESVDRRLRWRLVVTSQKFDTHQLSRRFRHSPIIVGRVPKSGKIYVISEVGGTKDLVVVDYGENRAPRAFDSIPVNTLKRIPEDDDVLCGDGHPRFSGHPAFDGIHMLVPPSTTHPSTTHGNVARILRVDTKTNTCEFLKFGNLPDRIKPLGARKLWSAGFTRSSSTGHLFCPPDYGTDVLHYIPPSSLRPKTKVQMSFLHATEHLKDKYPKWGGNLTEGQDGCLYAVSKSGILCIDPGRGPDPTPSVTTTPMPTGTATGTDGWGKLCLAKDGCMYATPTRGVHVIQLTIGKKRDSPPAINLIPIPISFAVVWSEFTPGGPDRALYSVGGGLSLKLSWVRGKPDVKVVAIYKTTYATQLTEGKDGMLYCMPYNVGDDTGEVSHALLQVDPLSPDVTSKDEKKEREGRLPPPLPRETANGFWVHPFLQCGKGRMVALCAKGVTELQITQLD